MIRADERSMKKVISILTVVLAVICCICIFTACNDDQKYKTSTHFTGDCQNKGFTRFLLPNGEYYDVPDENFGEHRYITHTETEATCVSEGRNKYLCSLCDHFYFENTPLVNHDYRETVLEAATCMKGGESKFTCSVCNDAYTDQTPKAEHEAGIYIPCGDIHKAYCKYGCDTEMDAETHEYDKIETLLPATCTVKGSEKHSCSKCGDYYTEETDFAAHEYIQSIRNIPTCYSDGIKVFSCKYCSDTYEEFIPKVPHTASESFTYDNVGHWTECKFQCGTKMLEAEHSLSSKFVKAICYEHSYTLYECLECDYSYRIIDENSDLNAHEYEAYTCVYCERDMLLDFIDDFKNKGDYQTDPIEIDNGLELCCFLDYITVYNVTSQKHFNLTYVNLDNSNYEEYLSNALQSARTATNWGYTIGSYSDNDRIVSMYISYKIDDNEFSPDKIATVTPYTGEYQNEVYTQLDSYQFENSTPRASDFEDFKYKNRRYSMEVSTSDGLFYAFEHGYLPIASDGSAAELMLQLAKNVLRGIINDGMSDLEKIRAIYMWLVEEVQYDYGVLNNADVFWRQCSSYYLEGVFKYRIAVCDGISKAFCVLAGIEGIKCIRVTGADHAWNKVWIDLNGDGNKEWYCSDATWGNRHLNMDVNNSKEILSVSDFLFTDDEKTERGQTALNYTGAGCDAVTAVNPYSLIYFGDKESISTDYVISNAVELTNMFSYIQSACDGRTDIVTVEFLVTTDFCDNQTAIINQIGYAYANSDLQYDIMRSISDTAEVYGAEEGYVVHLFIILY